MSALDSLLSCRRKASLFFGLGLALIALAWVAHLAAWPIRNQFPGVLAGFGLGAVFSSVLSWFMPDAGGGMPKSLLNWVESPSLRVLVAMLWVFPMLCFSDGFAKVFIARRYS